MILSNLLQFHCENIESMSVSSLCVCCCFFCFLYPGVSFILCVLLVRWFVRCNHFIYFIWSYFFAIHLLTFFALLFYQFVYYFFTPAQACASQGVCSLPPFLLLHSFVQSFGAWHAICSYFTSIYVH